MTGSKSTKRALLTSAFAIVICAAMLIGTSFAWFTDTASTAVNKIVSGKLKLKLEYAAAWNGEGEPTEWKEATENSDPLSFIEKQSNGTYAVNKDMLWEPGGTYRLQQLRISNIGNLALKYKVIITGVMGDEKLNDVIDWNINGIDIGEEQHLVAGSDSHMLAISGHMQETAGNEYQEKSISGITVTVIATQDTVEYDSNDNIYDERATYLNTDADGNILISTAAEFRYFALTVNKGAGEYVGKTVKLTADIDLANKSWTPVMASDITFDGNGHTVRNLNAAGEKNVGLFGCATKCKIKNLTVDGASVKGINHIAAIAGDALCAEIENCSVKNAEIVTEVRNNDDGDKAGTIAGYLSAESYASVKNCSVENCSVRGYRDIGGLVGFANFAPAITGNRVKNTKVFCDRSNNYKNYTSDDKFDINEIVGEYSGGTLDPSNTAENVEIRIIKPAGSQDELANIIADNAKDIKLGSGEYTLYNVNASKTKNTVLSIEGNGAENTFFRAGKETADKPGEGNADFSYENSDVAFKNLTVKITNANYMGFVRTKSLYFENCTISGRGSYWGVGKVVFKNCKFTQNGSDYNMWIYSGTDFLFENCTFNSSGKFINAYKEQSINAKLDFVNCNFIGGTKDSPAVVLKKDSNVAWTVSFTNCNATGTLYSVRDGMNPATKVTVDGVVKWENGSAVNQ